MTRALIFSWVVLLLSISGCGDSGPAMGKVTGTVKLDGKPTPKLMVVFVPKEGGETSQAITNSDGVYELLGKVKKGALLGLHTVSITTVREPSAAAQASTEMSSDSAAYANQSDPAQYVRAAQFKELVPAKYNSKSELVEEVAAGDNVIDFDLKTK